jgi:hypothetical protein
MTAAAMLRRIERLERRKPSGKPWRDPIDVCLRLLVDLQAVVAGNAFWLPTSPLSPEVEQLLALALRDSDRMGERLRAELPG